MGISIIESLKNIFGQKNSNQVIKTSIEQIPLLIEKDFQIKKHELEEYNAKKMSEAKYLQSKAKTMIETISKKELEEKENERFNRAAFTSKKQLENQLIKLLEKVDPKNRGNTLTDARAYSNESYALLTNEIVSFRKNIVYTSFYLKEEMKELGEILQELLNLFNEMKNTYEREGQLFEFEKIKENTGKVIKKKKEFRAIEEKKSEMNNILIQKQQKLEEQKNKILQKKIGKDMVEVKKLEEEMTQLMTQKQDLKTEISGLILNIDRPIGRFKQLVDSGRWKIPREEKEILDQFMINPMVALKKDPRAELFKKVLLEIQKAIEEGAVELKDKEKEKRLSAIQELINFDFFGKVFWKMNELQKKQMDINKELEKSPIKKDLEKEESKLAEIENEINQTKEKIAEIEGARDTLRKEMDKELFQIREFAGNCLKKTIIFEEEEY